MSKQTRRMDTTLVPPSSVQGPRSTSIYLLHAARGTEARQSRPDFFGRPYKKVCLFEQIRSQVELAGKTNAAILHCESMGRQPLSELLKTLRRRIARVGV